MYFMEEHDHYKSIFGRWSIHARSACEGYACPFHNPSVHGMVDLPMNIRASALVERMCSHGVGHPDPDSVAFLTRVRGGRYGVHGCCGHGCCGSEDTDREEDQVTEKATISEAGDYRLGATSYHQGGLMRCCLASLGEFVTANPGDRVAPGALVYCRFEKNDPTSMILGEDGVWRWNYPETEVAQ